MTKRVYVASKKTADDLKGILQSVEVRTRENNDQKVRNYNSLPRSFCVELESDMGAYVNTARPTPTTVSVFAYNNTLGRQKQLSKAKVYNIWENYTMKSGEKLIVNYGPAGVLVPRDPEGVSQLFELTANFTTADLSVPAQVSSLSRSGIASTSTTLYNDLGSFEGSSGDRAIAYYSQGQWVIVQIVCPVDPAPDGGDGGDGGGGGGDPGGSTP